MLKQPGFGVQVEKNVSDILVEGGVSLTEIEAVIWSHWHYDHIGDPSAFPISTALVVGPGFKEAFLPGYPVNKEAMVLESDFQGRNVTEIDFNSTKSDGTGGLQIGGFQAFDFFGDGSFYLLDSPGHTIGHMSGLARVTIGAQGQEADTFVLMGADACHHGGEFRPTKYLPMPAFIDPSPLKQYEVLCPGSLFEQMHPQQSVTEPFYKVSDKIPHSHAQAEKTVRDLEEFDAAENVLVVIAHDASLLGGPMEFFPRTLNSWQEKDLASKVRWAFLRDFGFAVEGKK